jgi:methylmalonyl-CoA mutase N-terminal domain/subunit
MAGGLWVSPGRWAFSARSLPSGPGLCTPSPESDLVGLRTQQVLGLEFNVTKVVNPLGGSYYIESLTDDIERRILDTITEIEARGDATMLSERGWFKKFFDDVMVRYAQQTKDGELSKAGLNCFQGAHKFLLTGLEVTHTP